ncbi:MAG TPA: O-antigen ligase family protein [Pyrinomonadaceae bacterium]|jgi:O-antigen ligase|nr:O-antigen ligase family protein [Pyrinomonadaceae bacterium]
MTTSISNAGTEAPVQADVAAATAARGATKGTRTRVKAVHTLASSFIFFILCAALVLSTLAYGTVHYWSLAVFQLGAALIIILWALDAWRSRLLRLSRNALQWPLLGLFLLGLFQLLPLGDARETGQLLSVGVQPVRSLSLDPYATRLVLVQVLALFVYFAAVLAFTDSPRRLRLLVRTIIIFGFALAIFGVIQSFTSPTKVYWLRELQQSTPFGPFINRHHFAGYMEMTLALPLGLLFSGAIEKDKRVLYIFASALMGVALIMTGSRGGIISLCALVLFLATLTGLGLRRREGEGSGRHGAEGRARVGQKGMLVRAGLALGLVLAFLLGTVLLGGESALSRFVGTVNAEDPTTGRAHFWSVTLDIIRHHPLLGTGLGAFGVVYTRYDSRNGMYRLDQAHNDYLQIVSDGGVAGLALGLFFVLALFRLGVAECRSEDMFRRGVAMGALAGCFAVLVHSFFDFTLHTTANALLFLTMAALATLKGRVEQLETGGHRRRRRRHGSRSAEERLDATTLPTAAS